mgnify:FL=1
MKTQDLLIRNENIQRLFDWYQTGRFIVNRKYQRKLVWTIEEKQKFINSILSDYPVPLFLLAAITESEYEIIDGMQRLNAIFSFIKGEFPIKYNGQEGYFDLQTMAATKDLMDKNLYEQKTPLLDRTLCAQYASYQLPLSITNFDDRQIEEIFRRINATGRQLSAQDLRQAGATHPFAEIVRKISIAIRRDSSPTDVLSLSQMEEISLSNRNLPYGINLEDTFWVKNGIITTSNMRVSRDEELVAYILLYILLGKNVAPSAKNLNKIYGYEDDNLLLVEKSTTEIEKHTPEKIQERFLYVLDQIQKTIDASGRPLNILLFGNHGEGMARSFQVIFLAYYSLLSDNKKVANYVKLAKKLDGIGTRMLSGITSDGWNAHYRDERICAVKGIIETEFVQCEGEDPATNDWISKLENLLMQSKIEQQLFDFKIGLHEISANPKFNQKCFSKIIKTLTAMANTQKQSTGYVIVGIADKEDDAKHFSSVYGVQNRHFNGFAITGVQEEVHLKYKSADEYYMQVKNLVKKEPIIESVQSEILRKMRLVNYFDKLLLVFSLDSGTQPIAYNNKFYERHATSVEEIVDAGEIVKLFSRFSQV